MMTELRPKNFEVMCLCGYYVLDAFVSHYFRSRFSLCPIMKEVFKDRFLYFVDILLKILVSLPRNDFHSGDHIATNLIFQL